MIQCIFHFLFNKYFIALYHVLVLILISWNSDTDSMSVFDFLGTNENEESLSQHNKEETYNNREVIKQKRQTISGHTNRSTKNNKDTTK